MTKVSTITGAVITGKLLLELVIFGEIFPKSEFESSVLADSHVDHREIIDIVKTRKDENLIIRLP